MISAILWDIDDTLLDFLTAEKAALKALFPQYGLGECSDDMIRRYSAINRTYWERLERGELTKPEVLVGRFTEFFEKEGLDTSKAPAFNDSYQLSLGDTIAYHDNSLEIVKSLKGRVKQYAVSNGTVAAQTKKLRLSGLGELMDGIFLSEEIGFEKPSIAFFNKVFERLGPVDRQQLLIVETLSPAISKAATMRESSPAGTIRKKQLHLPIITLIMKFLTCMKSIKYWQV